MPNIEDPSGPSNRPPNTPEKPSSELARDWLTQALRQIEFSIKSLEGNLEFTKTYIPRPPGPRPHPEDGGSDMTDWQAAVGEYQQWPEEREEVLETHPDMIFESYQERDRVRLLLDQIGAGDENVIEHYANLEKERLQTEKERAGMKFEGAEEASAMLDELFDSAGFRDYNFVLRGKKGSRGWILATQGTIGTYSRYMYFNHEKGRDKKHHTQISLSRDSDQPESTSVVFSDQVYEFSEDTKTGKNDGSAYFRINNGVVSGQEAKEDGDQKRFGQKDFDRFKVALSEIHADMREVKQAL